MNSKLVTATVKVASSILLIGGIASSSSASAKIPTPQSFETFVARQTNQSELASEPSFNSELEPTIELPSEATKQATPRYSGSIERTINDSRSNWEVETANENWLDLNHGEGVKSIVRLVIWRF